MLPRETVCYVRAACQFRRVALGGMTGAASAWMILWGVLALAVLALAAVGGVYAVRVLGAGDAGPALSFPGPRLAWRRPALSCAGSYSASAPQAAELRAMLEETGS